MATNDKFTIYCSKCKREVEPIAYFNGDLYCPVCRTAFVENISGNAHRAADPREINKEDFALSQQYFIRYLMDIVPQMRKCLNESDTKGFDELSVIRLEYLRQTIDYCKRAAYNGNPSALINLAFYFRSGYDLAIRNKEIASDKLLKLVEEVFGEGSDFDDEIKDSIAQKIGAVDEKAVAMQDVGGYSYFCKLVDDSGDGKLERCPLFGIVSIRYGELSVEEKESLLAELRRAANAWSNGKLCGLYYFDGSEFKALHGAKVEVVIDDGVFEGRDITHLVYRNANYNGAGKQCVKDAKDIVTSKDIVNDFFARLLELKNAGSEDCTISFCDWDAYICRDTGVKGKFDDLVSEVRKIWAK